MFVIKDICSKPKLHNLVLAGVWPPCCATSSLGARSAIHAASHVDYEKRVLWFSNSMHASGSVPIVMVLLLSAQRADGAPLLKLIVESVELVLWLFMATCDWL